MSPATPIPPNAKDFAAARSRAAEFSGRAASRDRTLHQNDACEERKSGCFHNASGLTRKKKPREGVVPNTLKSFWNGAVDFIDWLNGFGHRHRDTPKERAAITARVQSSAVTPEDESRGSL